MAWNVPNFSLAGQPSIGSQWADGILDARNDKQKRVKGEALEAARKQAVTSAYGPDGKFDTQRATELLMQANDLEGAKLVGGMADNQADRAWRREESQRAQQNADRAYGLQAQSAANAGAFNLGAGETRYGRGGEVIATGAPKPSEYDEAKNKAQAKADVDLSSDIKANAEGARGFLAKKTRAEALIKELGDAAFGPLQGSAVGRWGDSINPLTSGREAKRQELEGVMREMELDVAKMKLKGQGTVTDTERKIAKETLPNFTNMNSQTALNLLNGVSSDANAAIAREGGGAGPAAPAPPQGGPRPISSQQEYQALPPGTPYTAPDGTIRTKQ